MLNIGLTNRKIIRECRFLLWVNLFLDEFPAGYVPRSLRRSRTFLLPPLPPSFANPPLLNEIESRRLASALATNDALTQGINLETSSSVHRRRTEGLSRYAYEG